MSVRRCFLLPLVLTALGLAVSGHGQQPDEPSPPSPPSGDESWGLPVEMLEGLAQRADLYKEFALRFTCTEKLRSAHYDQSSEASRESSQRYSYMLERDPAGEGLREYRQELRKKRGEPRPGRAVDDEEEERFPPAYAWVFLFSRFNQPYFMYRDLGDRFEGFDWVHEIQFRGALPFTTGKDIRQWEGIALVDAVTLTPVEIRAEPAAQKERVRALFNRWTQSFNLLGYRLAPRPFGYRCRVMFDLRTQEKLSFPTELRYETFRAVGPKQNVPWQASVRLYEDYRFFKTSTTDTPGAPVSR